MRLVLAAGNSNFPATKQLVVSLSTGDSCGVDWAVSLLASFVLTCAELDPTEATDDHPLGRLVFAQRRAAFSSVSPFPLPSKQATSDGPVQFLYNPKSGPIASYTTGILLCNVRAKGYIAMEHALYGLLFFN